MRILKAAWIILITFGVLWASGIIPAIIPAAVPLANKIGNSPKFQLGIGTNTAGNCASYDANGNIQDFGAPCNGTAGSVAFNNITSGTNTTMAAHMGAGGTLDSSSTGVLEGNKIRNYTVAGLPAATSGNIAYVTDGSTGTDCTVGSGSNKVLCQANGTIWLAVGSNIATTPGGTNGATQFNASSAFGGFFGYAQPNISASGAPLASLPQSGWTLRNSAVLQDFANNVTSIHIVNNASLNLRTITRTITVPYTIYTLQQCNFTLAQNSQTCGVYLFDGTKYYGLEILSQSGNDFNIRAQEFTNATTASTTTAGPTAQVVSAQQAFKIVNNSTNRIWSYYSNGAWVQLLSETSGTFLTETSAGVGGISNCASTNNLDVNLLYWSVQ